MQIKVDIDRRQVKDLLGNVPEKQIPFAASKTINELAYKIAKKTLPIKADQSFEGGATAFTKRGFGYQKSTKRNLTAHVFVMPNREDYMKFMVAGGTRFPNKRWILSTTRHSRLNKYGNFTKATQQKMINDRSKYFKGIPRGMSDSDANRGIWERYGVGKRIRKVAAYTKRQQYRPQFLFAEHAEKVVVSRKGGFNELLHKNLQQAMRTAR